VGVLVGVGPADEVAVGVGVLVGVAVGVGVSVGVGVGGGVSVGAGVSVGVGVTVGFGGPAPASVNDNWAVLAASPAVAAVMAKVPAVVEVTSTWARPAWNTPPAMHQAGAPIGLAGSQVLTVAVAPPWSMTGPPAPSGLWATVKTTCAPPTGLPLASRNVKSAQWRSWPSAGTGLVEVFKADLAGSGLPAVNTMGAGEPEAKGVPA
jgi:hypothetical protein